MRISSLLPWTTAISWSAFAGSVAYAVLNDWLHIGSMFSSGNYNMLTVFRETFPIAFVVCALVGFPIALANTASSKIASVSAIAAWCLTIVLLLMFAIWLSDPIGVFLGLMFLFVLGLCLVLFGGVPAYLVLRFSGIAKAKTVAAAPRTFGLADWQTWILLAVALAPVSAYALPDTTHEYGCRHIARAVDSPLHDKGDIAVDLDKAQWPKLKEVMEEFGSAHGMVVEGRDPWRLPNSDVPLDLSLCSPGTLLVSASGWEDRGGQFRPSGDWYVDLRFYAPDSATDWESTVKGLLSALDREWPGIRFEASPHLGPSFKPWRGSDCASCRSKVPKSEYRSCLGERSPVRKTTMYLDANTADWPRLQRVMKQFSSAHDMVFSGVDASARKNAEPLGTKLCAADRLLIYANPLSLAPAIDQPPGWHVRLEIYAPETNQDSERTIKAFVSALDSEWPGAVGPEPILDREWSVKH